MFIAGLHDRVTVLSAAAGCLNPGTLLGASSGVYAAEYSDQSLSPALFMAWTRNR